MDARQLLREAVDVVDEADVPTDLRAVAFGKVFECLRQDGAATSKPGQEGSGDTAGPIHRIATRLGVPIEVAEWAYFVDGDRLELVLPTGRLDGTKSGATEQIALLVAAGRQAAGLDDGWTSVGPIREACENQKKNDPSNFATTIRDMGDVFAIRGDGRHRRVRMTAPAWDKAKQLLLELGR